MVNKKLIETVLAGSLLMVLAGASEEWHVMNMRAYIYFLVGQLVGCILFAVLADLTGRRNSLLIMAAPFCFGFISELFNEHIVMLSIGRALNGMAVGGAYVVLPIYVGEISDSKTRGSLVSTMLTSVTLGKFLVTGPIIYFASFFSFYDYDIFSYFCLLLAVIFVIVFGIVAPETPFYYLKKGHDTAAMISLDKFRSYNLNNEIELKDMQENVHLNAAEIDPNERVMACVKFPAWIKGLVLVFVLTISETFIDSVNSLAYNCFMIFDFMVVAGIEVLFSCLCPILVDRIGRKFLLILSFGGSAICMSISTILLNMQESNPNSHSTLLLFILALICKLCLVIGIEPIRFVLISELFSLKLKMFASAALTIFYFVAVELTIFFTEFSGFSYMVILISFVMTAITKLYFLETNNKSFQQIQVILNAK